MVDMGADAALKVIVQAQMVNTDEIVDEVNKANEKIVRSTQSVAAASSAAFAGLAGGVAAIGIAAVAGLTSLVAFEDAFAGVRKTVDADEKALGRLSDSIRELATELPVAATELARIGELGGQLGIEVGALEQFIETVTKLSVATVLSTENAALALARLGAIANIPDAALGDFFERTGAAIVELGNNFAATEDEIITTVLRIATAAEQSGASTQDALAFATALQAVGVPAQAGGTAVSRVFQEIQRAIAGGGEQLALFSQVAGVSIPEFVKLFGEDAAMAVTQFIEGLGDAETRVDNVQEVLKKLNLSQRRTQLAIGGLSAATGVLRDALITSRNAFESNVALQIEAAKRFNTTASQIQQLRNIFKEFTMDLSGELLPTLRNVVFFLQGLFSGLTETGAITINLLKGLTTGAIIAGLVTLASTLLSVTTTFTSAATAAAGFKAVLLSFTPGGVFKVAALLGGVGAAIGGVKRLFDDAVQTGGALQFAEQLGSVEEFSAGAIAQLNTLEKSQEVLRGRFADDFSLDFDLLGISSDSEVTLQSLETTIENITGKNFQTFLNDIGMTETALLNSVKHIQSIDATTESLALNMDFLFGSGVENLTNASGEVGDFFSAIVALPEDLKKRIGADTFLEELLSGQKPVELVFKDFTKNVDKGLEGVVKAFGQKGNLQALDEVAEGQEDFIETIVDGLDQIGKGEGRLFDGIEKRNKENLDSLAKELVMHEGVKEFGEAEIEQKRKLITDQRKKNTLAMREAGISEAIIQSTETSRAVIEMRSEQQEAFIKAQEDELVAQQFVLTAQETIAKNVVAIARESSRGIVSLFDDVPEQIKMSANEITRNLQDQAAITTQFMTVIAELQGQGFSGLAAMLAEQGPQALAAAEDFLADAAAGGPLATIAEQNIRSMREDLIRKLAEIPDEVEFSEEEMKDAFGDVGKNIAGGVAGGITENAEAIRKALIAAVSDADDGIRIFIDEGSPAKMFIPIGESIIQGIIVGLHAFGLSGTVIDQVEQMFEEINFIIAEVEKSGELNLTSLLTGDAFKAELAAFKTSLVSTFDTFVDFNDLIEEINGHQDRVAEAQEKITQETERTVEITLELTEANQALAEAIEKFGDEGVRTSFEQLNIDKARLRLINQESALKKKDTASERLAIKEAKREIDFLQQAVRRGVASEDELQQAKEALAELQGTTEGIDNFRDRAAFQERLDLQNKIAKGEIDLQKDLIERLQTESLAESNEVLRLQDRVTQLEAELARSPNREQEAQENLRNVEMDRFKLQLQLLSTADDTDKLGFAGVSQFRTIAEAAGMPQEQIDAIIEQVTTMGSRAATEFDTIARLAFDTQDFVNRHAAQIQIQTDQAEARIDMLAKKIEKLLLASGVPIPVELRDLLGMSTPGALPPGVTRSQINQMTKGLNFDHDGGFRRIGERAMVGEFGPEIISVGASGTKVTPTGIGRAGGISVENVVVNVTGVPSDPQSARKAAMSIRKALVNLEKEGSSSSILNR